MVSLVQRNAYLVVALGFQSISSEISRGRAQREVVPEILSDRQVSSVAVTIAHAQLEICWQVDCLLLKVAVMVAANLLLPHSPRRVLLVR